MATTVAVLGGGVGGLSAAHELAERGFSVTVYEKRALPGGKARSYPTPDGLPAEHGFRFFPAFYRHLPDTMARIPSGSGSALDRLVGAERILLARADGENELLAPAHAPETLADLAVLARFVFDAATQLGVPAGDVAWLLERLFTLLASCDARRVEQWDLESWWSYVQAESRSEAFRRYLADGLTRTLVAARAKEMSARTGGLILVQLLLDLSRAGARADRVLDAPTSEAWIGPWVEHLRALGVDVRLGEPVEGLLLRDGRIASATVGGRAVRADFYVAALPVEIMRGLLSPELRRAEPRLNGLDRLVTRWMNGFLLYLRDDLPLVRGHAIYLDSEWALTSISQRQFWSGVTLPVGGVLSIDISEWQRAGRVTGKVAALCTPEEIRAEVWAQLQAHLDDALDGVEVVSWFLDEAIEFPNPSGATNAEPLLVNTKGSWADRPDAATRIPNLMLAADYVRTHTDLATMEGANEAARRAVNAILDATRSAQRRCDVWPLREPPALGPARALDKVLWRLRRPAASPLHVSASGEVTPAGLVGRALSLLAR
ncbi:FAD-dependent oxidoreductase [Solirubrobacter ginsenosidimutans]|uniref:FAD-dependent oxidoreductase n=1 Tax=Solirubrobacter ginsenosidimutans TaxID=490573 RepID=A0A9X3MYA8_9ACTN|nr:FAD-dependent oxidoreductase [Solirubrobacter ginsenosidimutans]MDA0163565.1 FAD-dependent oxidoreductase [Solirubrobacter ginsenosidimutans]